MLCISAVLAGSVCLTAGRAALLNQHTVALDGQGKIIPWFAPAANAYDEFLDQRWAFIKTRVPLAPGPAPRSSYPQYYFYDGYVTTQTEIVPDYWMNDVGEKIPNWFESARLYYAYSGDASVMTLVRDLIDYTIQHGTSPATFAWPNFPHTTTEDGDLEFVGMTSTFALHEIQVDHAGDMGLSYFRLYQFTGEAKYLTNAIQVADVLAANARVGTATRSVWPYRVRLDTGAITAQYGANWIGCYDLLGHLVTAGLGNTNSYVQAQVKARNFILNLPMKTGYWTDGHSDNPVNSNTYKSNLSKSNTLLYLFDHPEFDPDWQIHVPRFIAWTVTNFVLRTTGGEPATAYGADIVGEQDGFLYKMDYQTARHAAECARWYRVSGDAAYLEKAYRCLNWVTYCSDANGRATESPYSTGIATWWSDCYGECPRMFYPAFAAMPEWAPPREDHILYSAGILADVAYGVGAVQYRARDAAGTEYLRLSYLPTIVTLDGAPLLQRPDLASDGWMARDLGGGDYAVTLHHTRAGLVRLATDSGSLPPSVSLTAPTAGAAFTAPAVITLAANAAGVAGAVTNVEFFGGAAKLGEDRTAPYTWVWSNVTEGSYTLTARATDDRGLSRISAPVAVTVAAAPPVGAATIGSTSEGTTSDYITDASGAYINANRYRASANQTVTLMRAKVGAIAGRYKCAIYSDSGGNASRLLRATTVLTNAAAGWRTFPLTAPLALTSGTYYWLAIWSDSVDARVQADTGGSLRFGRYSFGAWPDPVSLTGNGNFTYSLYATGTNEAANLPTVSIVASDPTAAEPGSDTGQFTVTRTGSTAVSLTVSFAMGGTATAGTDYTAPGATVTIPAGQSSATIAIAPMRDSAIEATETAIATLSSRPQYNVSTAQPAATVSILDDQPPTLTVDGAQTHQTLDGFGVNINTAWWLGGQYYDARAVRTAIDLLVDQLGATLFRAVIEEMDWEATNDNADPAVFNWTYYNSVFSNAKFTGIWNTLRYLNQKGVTDRLVISFMGAPPSWMGSNYGVDQGKEDEFAETVAALLYYARHTAGVQFKLVSPMNETELDGREGPNMKDPIQFTRVLHKLADRLDGLGLGDVRFSSPDTAGAGHFSACFDQMTRDSLVLGKMDHWGVHNYGNDSSGYWNTIDGAAIANTRYWVTETAVIGNLLGQLDDQATGYIFWDGFDCVYQHGRRNGYGDVPPNDWVFWEGEPGKPLVAYDAATQGWTPRKQFYEFAQVFRFVRPGARRIGVTGATAPFAPLLAFHHAGLGQVTLVGSNPSGSAATLHAALASLPALASLDLTYTTATTNLARGASVPVIGGTFSATIPAGSVFTLTGFSGLQVALTSPASLARFTAPATIPLAATATTATGSVSKVEFYNGLAKLGQDSSAPYGFTWGGVPMGDYALSARAYNALGGVSTSSVVNVSVAGALARVGVSPPSVTLTAGAQQTFAATAADALGHELAPAPVFAWSVSGGGTIDTAGRFTAGSSAGGPFQVFAASGGVRGTGTVSVTASATSGGGVIGNVRDGTLTDNIWDNGAWINACSFQAASNMVVSSMRVKVAAIAGRYKCAIYSDNAGSANRLLRASAEIGSPPAAGWYEAALVSPLALTSGTSYWLAIWSDHANARVFYAGNGGTIRWGRYNYGAWPDPISLSGSGTYVYSIYAWGAPALPVDGRRGSSLMVVVY